jgi:hypothetical protein
MKIIKATAGHVEYEVDGPPRLVVADVYGGEVTLILWDHPEDTLADMKAESRRIRASARSLAQRHKIA